ncbi:hypothetical protein BBJ28_00014125 [Nothophytophthora sp. Chile5]|nr:hypothetical protein BBJ28_00014125 [Nothophytophthora sp. Chile5]
MKDAADDGGPQAERSRRIETQAYLQERPPLLLPERRKPVEAAPASACVSSACCADRSRLGDECEFLRKYVERLLGQLRVLLQRNGELDRLKAMTDANNEAEGPAERLAPWLTSSEYTNPLLLAYDLKIQELVRPGVFLTQGKARKHREKMVLRMQQEPRDMHGMNDDLLNLQENSEYLQEINERIDVLMAENNMLMEQVSLQDDEMGAMKKELTDRDQQLQVMGHNFSDATLALQELRDACKQVGEEKTHCERQLQRYAASIAQLESAKESILGQVETARTDRSELENQLAEYETLLEKLKKSSERKDESFSERYQSVCVRLRELTNAVEQKEKAVDELQHRNDALQSELEAVRQDCEGMLNVLNSMEKQLTQYCAREDAVAESECKNKVEDAILEKEEVRGTGCRLSKRTVAARELQSRREIARLLERLRQQAADHVKVQEETLIAVTRKHEAGSNSREQEIRTVNAELTELRAKLDVAARNQKEADKKLADALRRSKDSAVAFEVCILGSCIHLPQAKPDQVLTSSWCCDPQKKLQQLSERAATAEEARDLRELEMRRTEAREAKDESEEQHRKVQLLNDQLNKVKADCASRYTNEFELLHQQNRDLKAQAAELEYKLSQAKKEATSALNASRNERERAEVRLIAEVESLKDRIQSLNDERKRADKSRQETEARSSVLSLQVQQLSRDLSDAKELLLEQEHACEDSDRKVSELSLQLTAALSKQQQFYRQERELRTALERLTLEKARTEREATVSEQCRMPAPYDLEIYD